MGKYLESIDSDPVNYPYEVRRPYALSGREYTKVKSRHVTLDDATVALGATRRESPSYAHLYAVWWFNPETTTWQLVQKR